MDYDFANLVLAYSHVIAYLMAFGSLCVVLLPYCCFDDVWWADNTICIVGGYLKINFGFTETGNARLIWVEDFCFQVACGAEYSELTKTSTALTRLAVTCVLSAARRLVLVFVNSL